MTHVAESVLLESTVVQEAADAEGTAVQRLAAAAAELAAGTEEAQASAEIMGTTMSAVAEIAGECRAAALQSLTGAREIEGSAGGAVAFTQALTERVTVLRQMVTTMSSEVSRQIDWVNVSVDGTMKSAKLIAGLERLSSEISSFVEVVVGIADQTNLLAFNAAIEAAKAGKHGLGFAVVADEVRHLAETSGHAAEEIMTLVADIQTDVRNVADDVTQIGQMATGEVDKARRISGDLAEIDQLMDEVTRSVREIQGMARGANGGATEMRAACQAIADATDRAAAASTQAQAAVADQARSLGVVAGAAGGLAQIAEELLHAAGTEAKARVSGQVEALRTSIVGSAAAASQIAEGIRQVDRSASELVAAAEETLAGAQTVGLNAGQAVGVVQASEVVAGKVASLLAANNRNVASMVQAIRAAAAQNQAAVENIERLEERARQIDKIVDAIVAVTTQTNLLALHGAIEAARAGKRGRGFAVVASDVRSLARESAEAAGKIKTLVRDIQTQILRVTRDVEAAGRAAQVQAEDASRSTAMLVKVESDMNGIHSDIKLIAGLASADVERANAVVRAMERVTSQAERLGQLTRDASAAANDTSSGMQELHRAVDEIASVVKDLH